VSAPTLRPLGVGEILDVALKIAWRNMGTLLRIVVVVVAPAQVLIALVNVSALPDYRPRGGFLPTGQNTLQQGDVWTWVAASLVTVVVAFFASEFATGACFRAVAETYLGRKTSWRESLAFAGRRFRSILWIVILGGALTILGALFCIIPGIYLGVAFAVALPVLMSEGQRGRKALGRSRSLVRGRWWKTALTLLVAGTLATILAGLVTAVVSVTTTSVGNDRVAIFFLAAVGGTLGAMVSTPFSAAYHTVLYFDLRVRKEAFDLRLLSSRLGVDPPPDWEPPPAPPPSSTARPPFWPPPPGWEPPATAAPPARSEPDERQPPFWPPPPGWKPPGE